MVNAKANTGSMAINASAEAVGAGAVVAAGGVVGLGAAAGGALVGAAGALGAAGWQAARSGSTALIPTKRSAARRVI